MNIVVDLIWASDRRAGPKRKKERKNAVSVFVFGAPATDPPNRL